MENALAIRTAPEHPEMNGVGRLPSRSANSDRFLRFASLLYSLCQVRHLRYLIIELLLFWSGLFVLCFLATCVVVLGMVIEEWSRRGLRKLKHRSKAATASLRRNEQLAR